MYSRVAQIIEATMFYCPYLHNVWTSWNSSSLVVLSKAKSWLVTFARWRHTVLWI